jgi:hypothetical protein
VIAALIIVFREVFEAGLIVGIVLAVTRTVPHRNQWIAGGVLAGILAACVVAACAGALSNLREPAMAIVAPIVERAHADGELRADFDAFDLLLTLRMVASALTDRHVDVVLRGLRP